MLYKSILSKLNAAKELIAEFVSREKKKQAEREAAKAAKAAKVSLCQWDTATDENLGVSREAVTHQRGCMQCASFDNRSLAKK